MERQYTCWLIMLFLQGNVLNCKATLGADCTSDTAVCNIDNAYCENNVCACSAGFTEESDQCLKALEQNCENADECVSNTVCETTCKCSEGFVDSKGLCAKVIGSGCTGTGTGECPANTNTVCVEQVCACADGYEEKNNVCIRKRVSTVDCTADGNECDTITSSACDTTPTVLKCKCDPGYEEDSPDGSACVKVIGSSCTGTDTCPANTNTDCVNNKCVCAEGYGENDNVCELIIGSSCTGTGTGDCPANTNTVCVERKCSCEDGYGEKNNVCKQIVSETACTNGNECDSIDNAECDGGTKKCQCSPNFVMNVDTCVSENSGTSTGVGAVTLVLSVFTAIQVMLR